MATPTKLAQAIAAQTQAAPRTGTATGAASRLQTALAGRRVFRPVTVRVHLVELAAVMTVVGSERSLDLEAEVAAAMEKRGLEQNVLNQGKFELELAWRTLAEAVRDSEQNPAPIGSAADWGELAPEVIGDLWIQYCELRAQQDPSTTELTRQEADEIRDAIVKKNEPLLRYFGVRRLSRYLLTLADPPASCSTSRSSPGASSPAT
jgi:hypothetical protein